jgi:hypothetical protein
MDSSRVIMVLSFITLNNCFGTRGNIIFFMVSKYHFIIDQGQRCHSKL